MVYLIFILAMSFFFYLLPMGLFLHHKFKSIILTLLFISLIIVSFFGIDLYEITLFVITVLIIHSLYKKDIPYIKTDSTLLDFNAIKFIYILPYVYLGKIISGLLASLVSKLFHHFNVEHQEVQMRVAELAKEDNILLIITAFFSICIVAPVTEEYAIRHFLYGYILKTKLRMNSILSAILSSLVFASLHDSVPGVANAFFAGLLFSWIYNKYGLWYGIASHTLFNLISFILIQMTGI